MKTLDATALLKMGVPESRAIGIALKIIEDSSLAPERIEASIARVLAEPKAYLEDKNWAEFAESLIDPEEEIIPLLDAPLPYEVKGKEWIEEGALKQMKTAMKLPVSKAGALMPDAHKGYGLPIGGVLATDNTVIPYAVGVDIGCRMCLSIYDVPLSMLEEQKTDLKKMLVRNTAFGRQTFKPKYRKDHEVLANPLFDESPMLRELRQKAEAQIGSSGGGNHFVEFGVVELTDENNEFGLPKGEYFSLLSHSGSRGLGATIANHYTKLAMKECKLPDEAKHLAWLNLDTELGQEYWLAMNLAGDYASACHHQIHERMAIGLRSKVIARVENHHNFAWKELDPEGNEWIVHRKGATPAGEGVLGVIPGSMTAPGFIVRGKGNPLSLNSASHGAGRQMSRTKAKKSLDLALVKTHLQEAGVEVIGSGLDEAPMAYKDINQVMEAQDDLVEVLGTFTPKIVRMCGENGFREVD